MKSRWIGKADALAEKVAGLEVIAGAGLEVIVLQEHDPMAQVVAGMEKSARGCILVAWLGGKNPETKLTTLRIGSGYSVSVWLPARPNGDDLPPIDYLAEAIAEGIHGWVQPDGLIHPLLVTAVKPLPDPTFRVVEVTAEVFRV